MEITGEVSIALDGQPLEGSLTEPHPQALVNQIRARLTAKLVEGARARGDNASGSELLERYRKWFAAEDARRVAQRDARESLSSWEAMKAARHAQRQRRRASK